MASRISPPAALLLLPPPPSFTFGRIRSAFEASVSDALVRTTETLEGTNRIATLDIALSIPELLSPRLRPRAKFFPQLQHYLTGIYTLVGAVATARDLELDSPGGIDVRVIFLDNISSDSAGSSLSNASFSQFGPILDLQALASSGRAWDYVFYPGHPAGQELADSFLSRTPGPSKNQTASIMQAISSSGDWSVPQPLLVPDDQLPAVPHYSVAVGGTFDHLHVGHKLLLTATALALEPLTSADPGRKRVLTIGVTGDAMLARKQYAEFLETWEERFQSTANFLSAIMDFAPDNAPRIQRTSTADGHGCVVIVNIQPNLTLKFVEFFDVCGPTVTDEHISALVLSKETRAGGATVNDERAKKHWPPLVIFEVDVLQSSEATDVNSFEAKISSTDIRRRRMNMAKV
ncbi:uncharacterized protein N7459_005833 [Penicillium hispanicum]|uniref:uncharacterized protein n=1 Tax=Penicillium hispanicum TaxID=1080232 RepID=UPI0025402528|nr:uncharacterized protein N7459_005833 [Penicillium hispanicum]KAJ5579848.1 hypothetical protein N7459_005833 [Penicillium hispanicum]